MPRNVVIPIAAILASLCLLLVLACGNGSSAEPQPTALPPATAAPEATEAPETEPTQAPSPTESEAQAPEAPEKLTVITISNIVGDWVSAVGQDKVEVYPLLPPNADPHTYRPGAQDITRVSGADLVVPVGLSLEDAWLEQLLGKVVTNPDSIVPLGEYVEPLESRELSSEHGHEGEAHTHEHDEQGHEHGPLDPHFWLDPHRVQKAVDAIAANLSRIDPENGDYYLANADAYNREIDALDAWIREQVATVPEERRLLVTSHDSFQYFALRYGFTVVGTVFAISTESEPSAQELGQLIEIIEEQEAPAVFTEAAIPARLSQRVAEDTGVKLIGGLHTGSLTVSGEADTYLDMMRHNTTIIVEALR